MKDSPNETESFLVNQFIKSNILKNQKEENAYHPFLHPHNETETLLKLLDSKNPYILLISNIFFFKLLKFDEHKRIIKEEIKKVLQKTKINTFSVANIFFCINDFEEARDIILLEEGEQKMFFECLLETKANFSADNLKEMAQIVLNCNISEVKKVALIYYLKQSNLHIPGEAYENLLYSEDVLKNLTLIEILETPLIFQYEYNTMKTSMLIEQGDYNILPTIYHTVTDYEKLKILDIHKGTDWGKEKISEYINQKESFLKTKIYENTDNKKLYKIIEQRLRVADIGIKINISSAYYIKYQQTGDIKFLIKSIKYHPNTKNTETLTLYLFQNKNFIETEEVVDKYLEIRSDPKILYLKGCLVLQRGGDSENIFKTLSLTETEDHRVFFNLGVCELKKGKLKQALVNFKRSQLIHPDVHKVEIINNLIAEISSESLNNTR
ncbi:hypothetical protein CDIK_0412 [Cucumispora dikerogammari]|nr:hypothetical protein CDIK_0412 [Cucumispora dikerogammari]